MSIAHRVIKNTSYLYLKMFITVFISLYSTRLILNSLGELDYGIFNIVGGTISMLSFLNSTMANATQRFMSYTEGAGDLNIKRKVFNASLILHLIIAILTLLLLLGAMYPLFNGIFNIETQRIFAAKIIYYSLIFSTFLTIINVPYDSVMNAHENMKYYSLIGIIESLLRLLIALLCVYTSKDKLIIYGILTATIPLITLTVMKIYCHRNYNECIISPKQYWDFKLIKQITFFSGWNFLTAISSLISFQGIGLVLNHFYGTALNAAQGIAQQLNGQLSSFSSNMMKALNPVIVKKAGSGNIQSMNKITIAGCKFSTYLIIIFAVPAIIEMPFILKIWLDNVPEWAIIFCKLQIIQTIICQMASSAATSVYGKGDIKGYAIYKSITNLMPILITFISFKLGGDPYWLYIPMILIWGIGGNIVIITYAKKKCELKLKDYYNDVVFPICIVTVLMFAFGYQSILILPEGFPRLIICCTLSTIGMLIALLLFGLTSSEIKVIKGFIHK